MKKVFKWAGGSRLKGNANSVGKVLDGLRKRNQGNLSPDQIVEAASSEDSPLHNYFEWDDSNAAQEYRLSQARYLIRSIKVEVISLGEKKPKEMRAFVSIESEGQRNYRDALDVMKDEDFKEHLFRDALREADAFIDKYNNLIELEPIISGIKEVKKKRLMVGDKIKKKAS